LVETVAALSLTRNEKGALFAFALAARMAIIGRFGLRGSNVVDGVAHAVLGSVTTLVLASIALRIFSSRTAGIIAGVLAGLNPLLWPVAGAPREPTFLLLWLSSGFLLIVAVDRPSSGCGLLAGLALALAALVRPSVIIFVPLLAAPLFDRRFPSAIRRALAGSAIFGFCLIFIAGTLRKATLYPAGLPVVDRPGLVAGLVGWARWHASSSEIVPVTAVWCLALAAFAFLGFIAAGRRGVQAIAIAVLALSIVSPGEAFASVLDRTVYWDPIFLLYASAGISRLAAWPLIG
jgi:predicted membrane-bound dolichyl-phosphate-mannose-protein mannosyltransferase